MSMKNIASDNSASSITGIDDVSVQPNALDLRLGKVFRILPNLFLIDEDKKQHRGTVAVEPDAEGYYWLEPGSYEVIMENVITVGDHEAGWVITRSTLNRNGVFLTSGLYDSGYGFDVKTGKAVGGVMAGVMHVTTGPTAIKQGTRIGQFLLFDAEMLHQYDGSYGNHKAHDQKYQS